MSVATVTHLARCAGCGTTNRVSHERWQQELTLRCSQCQTPLPGSDQPWSITDASFAADVEGSPLPVLLNLSAAWCGPCRILAPVLGDLSTEMAGRVRVVKLDIDENPRTASRLGVRSIPTLVLFKDGREVDRLVGPLPKQEIRRRLRRVI